MQSSPFWKELDFLFRCLQRRNILFKTISRKKKYQNFTIWRAFLSHHTLSWSSPEVIFGSNGHSLKDLKRHISSGVHTGLRLPQSFEAYKHGHWELQLPTMCSLPNTWELISHRSFSSITANYISLSVILTHFAKCCSMCFYLTLPSLIAPVYFLCFFRFSSSNRPGFAVCWSCDLCLSLLTPLPVPLDLFTCDLIYTALWVHLTLPTLWH